MKRYNLIHLGALLQKKYNMQDDFKLQVCSKSMGYRIRVVIPTRFEFDPISPVGIFGGFDEVILEEFADKDESIRAGYSAKANVLLIQE